MSVVKLVLTVDRVWLFLTPERPTQSLPQPYSSKGQSCRQQERQALGKVVVWSVPAIEDSQRLGNVEVEEAKRGQRPDAVVEFIRYDGACENRRSCMVSLDRLHVTRKAQVGKHLPAEDYFPGQYIAHPLRGLPEGWRG
jgi:hypothetical protein